MQVSLRTLLADQIDIKNRKPCTAARGYTNPQVDRPM
jgi:hypothetical protein